MPPLNRQTIQVLLVEDDRDGAEIIREYVASAPGLDVRLHRAETLASAEARLREEPEFDLVVLDLTLPDAAGTETLDRVAALAPRLPIVVLAGLEDAELAWEAVRRGAADYLLKDDLTPDLLLSSLRYALDRAEGVRRQRESEEWFRALVENVSDVVAVLDPEGFLRYASPSQRAVLGYDPGSRVGKSVLELVAPEHQDEARALLKELLEGGERVSFQLPVRAAAGDWRILVGDARNLLDVPAVRGVIVTARDVTTGVERERLLQRHTDELTERVKEQQCLYRVLHVLHAAAPTPVAVFDEVVAAIPHGFQFPASTAARLRIRERTWSSPGFEETPWCLEALVRVGAAADAGVIQVVRTGLEEGEGAPFIPEEQALIQAIADAVAHALGLARVEEELRDREAYFRGITEHSTDTIFILDGDLVPQYMSLAGVRALEPEAFEEGRTQGPWPDLYKRVHPDHLEPLRALLLDTGAAEGEARRMEIRARVGDEWRTLELAVRNLLDDPAVGGIVVNARDITERRRTEERYRTLFETTGQGVMYQNADGTIVSANPASERILGLTVDQMVGRKSVDPRWRAVRRDGSPFPGDEQPAMSALRTGQPAEDVIMGVYNPHEERTRWISVDARPQFRPGEAEPYQVYSTFTDITDRVDNEESLRRKDAILEAMSVAAERFLAGGPEAEAMDDVLGALGTATGVSSVDVWKLRDPAQGLADTLQYRWIAQGSRSDVGGPPLQPLPADLKWREPLQRGAVVHGRRDTLPLPAGAALERIGVRTVALLPVLVGADLWGCLRLVDRTADRTWSTAEIDALKAAAAIFAAALQRRRDEDALRQRDQQLLQVQKMEAVGRLAGGIAHDFNNLLTAVSGYADLASEESGDPRVAEQMAEIRKAADRGAGLTRQLLAFGRQTLVEERIMDLAGVVRAIEPMLDRLLGERIQLESVIDHERHAVRMDPSQVEQVIMNLVLNARDAVEAGGRIRVSVEALEVKDEQTPAMLPDRPPPGRYASLTVEDDGVGMDESVVEHVFEPFFTTKGPGRGTGLGLSTVYGIVRDAGGFIDVRSELGGGSRFTILIPAAEGDIQEIGTAANADGEQESGTGVILVVEDEAAVRAVAVRALRRSGYTVLEAGSGADALALMESYDGPFDLLLSDVVMPGVSGVTLSMRLREIFPDLRVILTSGYAQDEFGDIDLEASAIAFLPKPYTPASLVAKVAMAMRSPEAADPDQA